MNAVARRELISRQITYPFQIPPVAQLQREPCRASCEAGFGVELRERRFNGGNVAAVAIEEEDFLEPVSGQRTYPVANRRDERRRAK